MVFAGLHGKRHADGTQDCTGIFLAVLDASVQHGVFKAAKACIRNGIVGLCVGANCSQQRFLSVPVHMVPHHHIVLLTAQSGWARNRSLFSLSAEVWKDGELIESNTAGYYTISGFYLIDGQATASATVE